MSVGGERILLRSKYAYNAKHGDELTFPADAELYLLEKRENGWWRGEYNGISGLFPYNYVDVISTPAAPLAVTSPRLSDERKKSLPTFNDGKERAIALEDYSAKDSQQLDFKKDDIIVIVQKFPTGWWKGEVQGRQGVFPQKTVKLLSDQKDEDKSKKHRRARSKESGGRKRASSKSRSNNSTGSNGPQLAPPPGDDTAGSTESSFDGSGDDGNSDDEQTAFGLGAIRPTSSASLLGPPSLPTLPPVGGGAAKAPGLYVKALEPYQASGPGQLSFNKGDIIRVIDKKEEDLWLGELNKAIGLFPVDCVEEIGGGSGSDGSSMSGSKTIAIALFEYRGTAEGQLSFSPDDRITVTGKLDNGWWRGELNGKVGHFPGSYVREEGSSTEKDSIITPRSSASADSITSARQPTMKALAQKSKAIAVHKYSAQDSNQLSFEPNDEITVLAKAANGWWSGELRGKVGHFPGSYVKEIGGGESSVPLVSPRPATVAYGSSPVDPSSLPKATALFAYTAQSGSELSLKPGDEVCILPTAAGDTKGWLTGFLVSNRTQIGHFPASYVKMVDSDSSDSSASAGSSTSRTKSEVGRAKSVSLRRKSAERPEAPTGSAPPSKAPPPVPPPSDSTAPPPGKPLPPVPPAGSRASMSLPNPAPVEPSASAPPHTAPPALPPKDKPAEPVAPEPVKKDHPPIPTGAPVVRAVSAAIAKSDRRASQPVQPKPPAPVISTPRVEVSHSHSSSSQSSSSAEANAETAKELEKFKNAMVKLQQQTKQAVEEMLSRIDAQQKERLKLEYVMRDMKRTLKEEKEARLRVEQQNRVLYNELQALKRRQDENAADSQIQDQFSGMSATELRNQVRKISSQLDQEVHARQDLQSFVVQLQSDVDAVKRAVRAGTSSTNTSGSYSVQQSQQARNGPVHSAPRQPNGHVEHIEPDDYFYRPS